MRTQIAVTAFACLVTLGSPIAFAQTTRIAERSVLPDAIYEAGRLAAEKQFTLAQVVSTFPELDLVFHTNGTSEACRVRSRILRKPPTSGVFVTDVIVRADSVLGSSPSRRQKELCAKAAEVYFPALRQELSRLIGADRTVFVNGPDSVSRDASEWIRHERLWRVTDDAGDTEAASLEITRKGTGFDLVLFQLAPQGVALLRESGKDLLGCLKRVEAAVESARRQIQIDDIPRSN